MKRLMVVTASVAMATFPLGCGKGDGGGRPALDSANSSRQETAWKTGADPGTTGAQSAEVRPAPNVAQPPSTLPMAAEGAGADLRANANIRRDLKAPPVMVGAPEEEANAS